PGAATYGATEQAGASVGEQAGEGVQEVFVALQELLAQVRGGAMPRRETPADAAPITSRDLLRLLSHMQQHAPVQVSGEFDLREQLEQLLSRASARSGKARVVGEVDEDVINLVS